MASTREKTPAALAKARRDAKAIDRKAVALTQDPQLADRALQPSASSPARGTCQTR